MKGRMLALGAMVLMAVVVFAVPGRAGDLNPPGAPAPTMKTLDQIQPTWDQVIPDANNRFKLVMPRACSSNETPPCFAAVLDKETGLVWDASPDTTPRDWQTASTYCLRDKLVGNRLGWRLPTIQELGSLVDRSVSTSPKLPTNSANYFSNVQSSYYWSATTYASSASVAWHVNFNNGTVDTVVKTFTYSVWCVRGGSGLEAQ